MDVFVAKSSELQDGERKIITHDVYEIGVIRAEGKLHAYLNVCPHQGGPVCEGMLIHKVEEIIGPDRTYQGMRFGDELHIVCPWHGWEFSVASGRCAGDGALGLKKFKAFERDGDVYVAI